MMTGGARPPVRDQSSRRAGRGGKFAKENPVPRGKATPPVRPQKQWPAPGRPFDH